MVFGLVWVCLFGVFLLAEEGKVSTLTPVTPSGSLKCSTVKLDDWVSFVLLEEQCPLLYRHVHLLQIFFNKSDVQLL